MEVVGLVTEGLKSSPGVGGLRGAEGDLEEGGQRRLAIEIKIARFAQALEA